MDALPDPTAEDQLLAKLEEFLLWRLPGFLSDLAERVAQLQWAPERLEAAIDRVSRCELLVTDLVAEMSRPDAHPIPVGVAVSRATQETAVRSAQPILIRHAVSAELSEVEVQSWFVELLRAILQGIAYELGPGGSIQLVLGEDQGVLQLELILDHLADEGRVHHWAAGDPTTGSVSAELVTLLLTSLGSKCPVALGSKEGVVRLAIPLPATVRV